MKLLVRLSLIAAAPFLWYPTSASAQYLRCENEAVNVGEMRATVLQRCGEPVVKESFCKPVDPQSVQRNATGSSVVVVPPCENVDEWTYNPGYGQFMTTLQFQGGKVTAIKYGDRVK